MFVEDISDRLGFFFLIDFLLGRGIFFGVRKIFGVSSFFLGFFGLLFVLCDIGVTLIVFSRDFWLREEIGVLCIELIKFFFIVLYDCFFFLDDNWFGFDLEVRDFFDCWEFFLIDGIVSLEGEGFIMFFVFFLNEWWVSWGGEGLIIFFFFFWRSSKFVGEGKG